MRCEVVLYFFLSMLVVRYVRLGNRKHPFLTKPNFCKAQQFMYSSGRTCSSITSPWRCECWVGQPELVHQPSSQPRYNALPFATQSKKRISLWKKINGNGKCTFWRCVSLHFLLNMRIYQPCSLVKYWYVLAMVWWKSCWKIGWVGISTRVVRPRSFSALSWEASTWQDVFITKISQKTGWVGYQIMATLWLKSALESIHYWLFKIYHVFFLHIYRSVSFIKFILLCFEFSWWWSNPMHQLSLVAKNPMFDICLYPKQWRIFRNQPWHSMKETTWSHSTMLDWLVNTDSQN